MFKSVIKEELRVPAHIDYLGELRNFVTKTGKKHGFSDSIVNAFKLSIDEAATNIIKHAYRDEKGDITMRIIVKKNSLTVLLIDQGRYYDPAQAKDPDLKRYIDIGKKGGLGIFIMRKLIDEIDYRHTTEGNELRLTKYKDGDFRRKIAEAQAQAVPATTPASAISLSLKSRYSIFSAAILTLIIAIGYSYFYFSNSKQTINDIFTIERSYSETIARNVVEEGETALSTLYIFLNINGIFDVSQYDEVRRLVIVDADNILKYSSDSTDYEVTHFKYPADYKIKAPDVFQYKLARDNIKIFDIVSPIYSAARQKIGEVHLQIKKDYVDNHVSINRHQGLRLAMLIQLIGYFGVTVLIYIVMNPFRKLSDWISDLGHGEVKDEVDFDTADELGEIAKAFSEITDKFRKSQVNLAEQERLQKEMQLAQDIQQTLLPNYTPEMEGYEIASFYEAAKQVGGDYYDFVEVDKDTLGIVVADVSGKGVPGSLIMTMIRTVLRTEARGVKSASEVLARLNDFVVKDMKKGMFVTVFYVIIDSKKRRLNYASAGHNPMILYRQSTNKTYYLNPKGFPVGISLPDNELFKKSIESDTIQLAQDDVLIIYTDGITEAMNNKRELFGEERFLDVIRKYSHLRVQPFAEKIQEEIVSFTQGYEQSDDITFLAMKEKSSPVRIELQRAQLAHRLIFNGKSIRESCEEAGITTYAYYNKYKKIFEEDGIEAYTIDETISVEAKHLSIEEKTKIYDIIKKHPEYGAKRISEELNTETYGYTNINESRIYDELVRSRLNTRQLREAYVARSGKKKRMKPPGTPMLTLDGRIIIDKKQFDEELEEEIQPDIKVKPKKISPPPEEKETEIKEQLVSKDFDDDFYMESLMTVPIVDLLEKKHDREREEIAEPTIQKRQRVKEEVSTSDEEVTATEQEDETFEISPEEEAEEDEGIREEELAEITIDDLFDDESEEVVNEDAKIEQPFVDVTPESEIEVSFSNLFEDGAFEEDEMEKAVDELSTDNQTAEMIADLNEDISDDEIEDSIEIGSGLDHDFSFKDIWEDDSIVFEDDEESEFVEIVEKVPNNERKVDIETNELKATPAGDFNRADNYVELEDAARQIDDIFGLDKEDLEINQSDQISFTDLLDAIEQQVSFFDSGTEVDEEDFSDRHPVDEDKIMIKEMDDKSINTIKEKHLTLGWKYYKENNYDKAIENFKQVIEMYPDYKEIHIILGNAYFRNNMSEQAVKEYQLVREIDPYDVDAYENMGVVYANRGEYSKAISAWEKLLKIDPDRIDIKQNVEKVKHILEKVNDKI